MEDISINDWLTILSALGEYHDKHAALAESTGRPMPESG